MDLTFSDSGAYVVLRIGTPWPDDQYLFHDALLEDKLTGRTICGSVRIDTASSDWHVRTESRHGVILHLVGSRDKRILHQTGELLTATITPARVLSECYGRMASNCEQHLARMESIERETIILRLLSERLERKSDEITTIYKRLGDWREACYVAFMRSWGYKEKKDEFESLALALPYRFVTRHMHRAHLVEALLLGQGGYLSVEHPDEYTSELIHEWQAAKSENSFKEPILDWQNAKTRPSSMPAISIVRAATILTRESEFMERILSAKTVADLNAIFDIQLPVYWRFHTAPSREVRGSYNSQNLSREKISLIVINFVAPFVFAYGTITGSDQYINRAIDFLDQTSVESNAYVNRFASHGVVVRNAFDSQALIQLCSIYCARSRCAACPLGADRLQKAFRQSGDKLNLQIT